MTTSRCTRALTDAKVCKSTNQAKKRLLTLVTFSLFSGASATQEASTEETLYRWTTFFMLVAAALAWDWLTKPKARECTNNSSKRRKKYKKQTNIAKNPCVTKKGTINWKSLSFSKRVVFTARFANNTRLKQARLSNRRRSHVHRSRWQKYWIQGHALLTRRSKHCKTSTRPATNYIWPAWHTYHKCGQSHTTHCHQTAAQHWPNTSNTRDFDSCSTQHTTNSHTLGHLRWELRELLRGGAAGSARTTRKRQQALTYDTDTSLAAALTEVLQRWTAQAPSTTSNNPWKKQRKQAADTHSQDTLCSRLLQALNNCRHAADQEVAETIGHILQPYNKALHAQQQCSSPQR